MTLYLNVAECEKAKVPIDTALFAASLYFGKAITSQTFQDVCARGLIEYDGFTRQRDPINARITPMGVELIESLFLNSEFREEGESIDRYDILAEELRKLYPTGRKEGTQQMWKDSAPIIAKRLKALVKKYKVKFTNEQAIEATKRYIQSFNGDYRYMQVLKYFIIKKDPVTGDEVSQLLSFIENPSTVEDTDWTTNMV